MLSGRGLDPWAQIPGLDRLKVAGLVLRANRDAREAYSRLERDPAFLQPLPYGRLRAGDHDVLVLPGGHRARGMRVYLESTVLQEFVGDFFDSGKPVGAICHGVVLAARSISKKTGKSVLFGKKTTGLTWSLERRGWSVGRVVRFWDPDYYRTYVEREGEPAGYRSVESEVKRALAEPGRLPRCAACRPGRPAQAKRSPSRRGRRRPSGLRRERRSVRLGAMARRREHLCPDARGGHRDARGTPSIVLQTHSASNGCRSARRCGGVSGSVRTCVALAAIGANR